MKAFINIPKRKGSSICTRNGAILEAIHAPTVKSLRNSWSLEGDGSDIDAMLSAKQLRGRLAAITEARRQMPITATFADLEQSGIFSGLIVLERRGYWRVEVDCPPEADETFARIAADNHSNFGTY